MTTNEVKMGHIGCLMGHATNFDSGILNSGHISKHQLKEEKSNYPVDHTKKNSKGQLERD